MQVMTRTELDIFKLSEEIITLYNKNNELYRKAARKTVDSLYELFFGCKHEILGINHRLKSEKSLREKIIRRKVYKVGYSAEKTLDAIPDIIGIMVECEFMNNEKKLFDVIDENFREKHDNGFYYNKEVPDLFIDMDTPQPIKQKNGNSLYKMDCFCLLDGQKINFELQIKSLVNSFWSEVEHNIIYKNNYYLPSDSYINEMMDSVRMNLLGLDKILTLISNRVDALNSFTVMKDLEMTDALAKQLISDLLNEKMHDSLGFTVDTKNIRDLLAIVLMKKAKKAGTDKAFYLYLNRFQKLLSEDICFSCEIGLEDTYITDSSFKQKLGDYLLSTMNFDFEWHSFFVMLFQVEDGTRSEIFDDFLSELQNIYCKGALFAKLETTLPETHTREIKNNIEKYIAKALCEMAEYGVQKVSYYKKGIGELNGFLSYTLNCIDNLRDWRDKKANVTSVIHKILTT